MNVALSAPLILRRPSKMGLEGCALRDKMGSTALAAHPSRLAIRLAPQDEGGACDA